MKCTLYSILQSVQQPDTFATGGKIPPFLPNIQVDNLGKISLLLCRAELKGECEQAPYGYREETIVNIHVCPKCIAARRLKSENWNQDVM